MSLRRWLHTPLWIVWATPLILLAPVYLTGRALFWGTPMLQFIPWWKTAWDTLLAGHLPLWNQWNGMGAPLLANYQSALLYPPTWAYFVAYTIGGIGLMTWLQAVMLALHLAWSGIGMGELARRIGLGEPAQAVCGLAFGLSGYMVARAGFLSINAAAAWLPWVLLFLTPRPGESNIRPHRSLAAACAIAMLLLAGHAQTAWYTLLLAGLWVGWFGQTREPGFFRRVEITASAYGRMVGATMLGVGLAMAQLLPTAEYLLQSQRSSAVDYDYALNYSFWPWRLLTLLAPELFGSPVSGDFWGYGYYWEDAIYIGLLPLLLALGALFHRRNARSRPGLASELQLHSTVSLKFFLALVFSIALLLALGKNTPVFPWLYHNVPTFAMFQAPTRWMLWGVFALSMLAAFGVQTWRRPTGRGLYWTRLATMGGFAILVGAGLAWSALGDVSPSFIRATAMMGVWGVGAGLLSLSAPSAGGLIAESDQQPKARIQVQALEGLEHCLSSALHSLVTGVQGGASTLFRQLPGSRSGRSLQPDWGWQLAVVLWIALDLLVAGWGLNPGIDLSFYTETAFNANELQEMAHGGRLYIPKAQEEWFKYVRYLRFDTFDPGQDWHVLRTAYLPNLNLLDSVQMVNNFDPLVPGQYAALMEALETASLEGRDALLKRMSVGVVINNQRDALYGLRYTPLDGTMERWRFAGCSTIILDEATALKMLSSAFISAGTVILQQGGTQKDELDCTPHIEARYGFDQYNPNLVGMIVQTDQAGYVILADTWYPGWQAWVDDRPVPILVADTTFRAVAVSAGGHVIRMVYRPLSFYLGVAISLASLVTWAILMRRQRRANGAIE